MDSLNKPLMKILYGVAYHRDIDFASVIFEQVLNLVNVKDKQRRNYIPFIRFFTLIISHYLDIHPQIPKHVDEQIVCLQMMKTVQRDTGSVNVVPRPIPDSLLQLVDPTDPTIRAYRELVAPMEPAAPQEPTQGAHRDTGEGSSRRGSKQKNIVGKTSEGVRLVVVSQSEGRQKQRRDRSDLAPSSLPRPTPISVNIPQDIPSDSPSPPPLKRRKTSAKRSKHQITFSDSENTNSDPEPASSSQPTPSTSMEFESDPIIPTPFSRLISSGDDDYTHAFSDVAFDFDASEKVLGAQGGYEGVVENIKESEWSGRVTGSKENVEPPQTTPERRDTTFITEVHSLHQGFEQAESSQLSHALTPRNYSDSSQQELVLTLHGEQPRLLTSSRSELIVIETRSIPPQLLTSLTALIRSNLSSITLESRLCDLARLRGVAGISIGTTLVVDSQGLLRNPARAIITPTLSAGLLTQSEEGQRYERLCDTASVSFPIDIESPGSLRDPGVIPTSLSVDNRAYERLSDTGHGLSTGEHSMGCKALDRTVYTTGNPESVVDFSGHTTGPHDSVVVSTRFVTSAASSSFIPPFIFNNQFQTSSFTTPTPPIFHSTSQTQFIPPSPTFPSFTSSPNSPSSSSFLSYNSLSLNDMQVLFHAKLLTSTILTPTQSALLSILNNSSLPITTSDTLTHQVASLTQRVSLLEQTCRPSAFSSSYRHDDPDSEDQHEGENRGQNIHVSVGQSHAHQSQQQKQISGESGNEQQDDENVNVDFDEEFYNTEPINVMYQTLMLEYEKEGNDDEMVIEKESENIDTEPMIEEFDDEEMFQTSPHKSHHASTSVIPDFPPVFDDKEIEEGELNEEIFDQIIPPNEEVIVELEKDVGESSKSKQRMNEGKFFKDKEVQLDLKSQQLRKTLRAPFIEEQAYKIYSKTDFVVNKFNVIGAYLFSTDDGLKNEYHALMRRLMCKDENEMNEQRKFRIKSYIEIDCVKLARLSIPRFHVYRTNDKRYTFSEADFHRLPLNEIMDVYDYLRDMILKPWEVQVALKTVKRYMKALIQISALEDFQLGLESVKRKINVTKPNQRLEGFDLETIPTCMILIEPEKGFVLRNGLGKKNFIRLAELHKYSDGTLALAYKCFHTFLKSKTPTEDEIPLIEEVMDKLHGRLFLRVQIRQIEKCHGIRKKMFYKGSQFVKEYVPRGQRCPQGNFPTSFDSSGPYLANDPRNRNPRQI